MQLTQSRIITHFPQDTLQLQGVEKLVIHPDYYQFTGDTVVGHTDVALVKTKEAVFELNAARNASSRFPWVVPICLPPMLGYMVAPPASSVSPCAGRQGSN